MDGKYTGGHMKAKTHRALTILEVWCGDGVEEAGMVVVAGEHTQRLRLAGWSCRRSETRETRST